MEAASDQVRVDVGAGDPGLDPPPRPVADDAEAAGAVVLAPDHRGRGPAAGHVAPVRVHGRRRAPRQLAGGVELPRQEAPPERREPARVRRVGHQRVAALGVPQAGVHVARGADVVHRPLGHEGRGPALLRRDLLDPVLEHEVVVGGDEGLVVGDVHLVLPPSGLSLGELDGDAGGAHLVADAAQDVLLPRRLHELVVLDRRHVRRQALPPLGAGLLVGVEEEEELELGGAAHAQPALGGPLQLAAQDPTG